MSEEFLANFNQENLKKAAVKISDAKDVLDALKEPATAGGYTLTDASFSRKTQFDVFGQPLQLGVDLTPTLEILPVGKGVTVFADENPWKIGKPWAKLQLATKLNAGAERDFASGAQSLSLNASASAEFHYVHLLPAASGDPRRTALSRAVRTGRLPGDVELNALQSNEVHHWSRAFYFDFGLKAQYGTVFDIESVKEVFDDLPIRIQAHIEATLSATLGFGLYDFMDLRVARVVPPDGGKRSVRLRLERRNKRDLSLGVRVVLQGKYDLGASSLLQVLDESLGTASAQRIMEALADVRQYLTSAGEGQWSEIKDLLTARTKGTLQKYFDEAIDLDEWVDTTPQVQELLSLASKIVDTEQSIDGTVRGWWSDLLQDAHLGQDSKIRGELQKVVDFNLDSFVRESLAELPPDLVEALAGEPLDDLADILQLRSTITKAQGVARKALDFFQRLDQAPDDFLNKYAAFAEKTGIRKAVDELQKYDTPAELKAALEEKKNSWLQDVASGLVNKSWGLLQADDLESISKWAKKMDGYLEEIQNSPDRLRQAIEKLRGDFNLDLSFFYQTVTTRSAVVDLLVDPTDGDVRKAMRAALKKRDAQLMLNRLPGLGLGRDGKDQNPDDLPYEILESIFTWRRTTTGTLSLIASFLGKNTKRTIIHQRTAASTTHIQGDKRTATYIGGFERTIIHATHTFQSGVWVEADAKGEGRDMTQPFTSSELSLQLGMARTDLALGSFEIDAYFELLRRFDFLEEGPDPRKILDGRLNHQTRFSLQLTLPLKALKIFQKELSEAEWKGLYVEAAQRWFRDEFLADRIFRAGAGVTVEEGRIFASLVRRPDVQSFTAERLFPGQGVPGPAFSEWMLSRNFVVDLQDRKITVPGAPFHLPLSSVIWHRDNGYDALQDLYKNFDSSKNPADLQELVSRFGKTMRRMSAGKWENPMFDFWCILALLDFYYSAEGSLEDVRGVAKLDVRPSDNDSWETPQGPDAQGKEKPAIWIVEEKAFDPWPNSL